MGPGIVSVKSESGADVRGLDPKPPTMSAVELQSKKGRDLSEVIDIEDVGAGLSPLKLRDRTFLQVADFAKTEYCSLKVSSHHRTSALRQLTIRWISK